MIRPIQRNGMLAAMVFAGIAILVIAQEQQAGGGESAREIVSRAIKARGLEKAQRECQGAIAKGRVTSLVDPVKQAHSFEGYSQGPNRSHIAMHSIVQNVPVTMKSVIDGDAGWHAVSTNVKGDVDWLPVSANVKEISEERLTELKKRLYAGWVTSLIPLQDPRFTLSLLAPSKVAGKDAIGVLVAKNAKPDVKLFFDKTTSLLLKCEFQIRDIFFHSGRLVSQELFYDEYKEFSGIKFPTKGLSKVDGKDFVAVEYTEIRPVKSIDDAVFTKP